MKKNPPEIDKRIKKKTMNWLQFFLTYLSMLLLVGFQVGIIVFPGFIKLNSVVQVTIVMGYWVIVAYIFGHITNYQIKEQYDKPLRKLSRAAKKVAGGDFSVYVTPPHTADKYDYIDVMLLDFNTMVKELGSIETLKNDFVSNVSHEIKTPLAIIKNYTTVLKNNNISRETREGYMDTIIDSVDNLSNLVSNILRLNKLENQEIETLPEEYDLCRQLSECILRFEPFLDEKNINLSINIEDKATITADENMLEIVWNNLLSNAIKYTNFGDSISLTQTSDSDTVTVIISDTGCGMEEKTMKHIFDKFYQADTSHSGEGNGLGLALASKVVGKINGTIAVTSTLGKGSTFTVVIPIDYNTI